MIFNFKNHTLDYLVLSFILTFSTISLWLYRFSTTSARLVSIFLAIGYVTWGVAHHRKSGHIDRKIFLEYFGIALLGLVIIFSLL